jgi:hypothetical protein
MSSRVAQTTRDLPVAIAVTQAKTDTLLYEEA